MEQLLAGSQLSMITRHADSELRQIHDAIEHKVLVDGRADVEEVLGKLLACKGPRRPKTLDLIGHSTPNGSLLQLGIGSGQSGAETPRVAGIPFTA